MKIVHFKVNASPGDGSMTDADEGVGDRREIYYFDLVAGLLDPWQYPGPKSVHAPVRAIIGCGDVAGRDCEASCGGAIFEAVLSCAIAASW